MLKQPAALGRGSGTPRQALNFFFGQEHTFTIRARLFLSSTWDTVGRGAECSTRSSIGL